jgi:hypothetical protein
VLLPRGRRQAEEGAVAVVGEVTVGARGVAEIVDTNDHVCLVNGGLGGRCYNRVRSGEERVLR